MSTSLKDTWRNDQYIQTLIWVAFPLIVSIPLFRKYSIEASLWVMVSTAIYMYWLIFGHFYFAFRYLIGQQKNIFKYLTRLLMVIAIGILIHAAFGFKVNEVIEEKTYNIWDRPWAFMIWTAIEGLIFILLSSLVRFSFDYFKLQSQQQQIENQRLEAELKYLKLQINPHFLFNTLNNLLLLTNKQSPQASAVVEKLAYMMRYLLEKDRKNRVPLPTEIEFLNAYIDLERLRMKDIDISFDIEGECQQHSIPPALLITLVENAFKHGVKKSIPTNFVHIELKASPDELFFQVTNPIHKDRLPSNALHSIGLDNLQKRLNLLFPDQHRLEVGPKNEAIFEAQLSIYS